MSWNLSGDNSENANSISGFPVIIPPTPTSGETLLFTTANNGEWVPGSGGGGGSVTSVGLTGSGIFNITNSPIVTAGNINIALSTETAATLLAGPTTGAAAIPTFRSLVISDLPAHPFINNTSAVTNTSTVNVISNGVYSSDNQGTETTYIMPTTGVLANDRVYITERSENGCIISFPSPNLFSCANANSSANDHIHCGTTAGQGAQSILLECVSTSFGQQIWMPIAMYGLWYLTSTGTKINAVGSTIGNIPDVTITTPTVGQALVWNGTAWANSTPTGTEPTIYNSDGTVSISVGATRTVALPSGSGTASFLDIFGGYLQNNFVGITNPSSTFATNQNTMITADTSGVFRGYSLGQTLNSARVNFDFSLLNTTTNALIFYGSSGANNMTFNATISMVFNQSFNQPSYIWDVCSCYGCAENYDVWQYIPPRADSGWQQNLFNDYILEINSPGTAPQDLFLRIRQIAFQTVPAGTTYPGTITITRRENDTTHDGTYAIPSPLTPYLDTGMITQIENNAPRMSTQYSYGQGQPADMAFTIYGQRFIRWSFTFSFDTTSTVAYNCIIELNGSPTGTVLSSQLTTAPGIVTFSYSGEGIETAQLVQTGYITSYAGYANTFSLNVPTGFGMSWGNYFYSITIDQYT
jgi:hypothetical protein